MARWFAIMAKTQQELALALEEVLQASKPEDRPYLVFPREYAQIILDALRSKDV